MPHADLHGSKIAIDTGDGHKETFELVRVGTVKEFETVKAALANRDEDLKAAGRENGASLDKWQTASQKLVTTERAYKAEKEKNAEGSKQLSVIKAESDELREERTELLSHIKTRDATVNELRDTLAEEQEVRAKAIEDYATMDRAYRVLREDFNKRDLECQALEDSNAKLCQRVADAQAELEDLVPVKAQLEETNTALEVSQKNFAASEEAVAALKMELLGLDGQICEAAGSTAGDRNEMLAEVVTERNVSRTALEERRASFASLSSEVAAFIDNTKTPLEALARLIETLSE